jgi:5'-methylthioadenosine phosphorylase
VEDKMPNPTLAVIGGSGFYHMEGIADVEDVRVPTPFGDPSDAITVGTIEGERVAFLPRHGRGHRISPSELNQRANIFALKTLGVEQIISISACGSMREGIRPLDVVVPDQIFDRTRTRPSTFFGDGLVAHVGFANPFCPDLSALLYEIAAEILGPAGEGEDAEAHRPPRAHRGGTYLCIEGPQFSTRAESRIYRSWGVDLIGMTVIPEAKLAREAEICYGTLAFATDYDVWHDGEESVSVEMVVENLLRNVATARQILRAAIGQARRERACGCQNALESAIITQRDSIPPEVKAKLAPIVGKYV